MAIAKKSKAPPARRPSGAQLGEANVRAMILQGGAQVFSALGVRAASVEHILEAAKLSRRTFYKHYAGKEDVALALYKMGTKMLVEACERAVREESDPLRQFERCIEAHLATSQSFGRLVFVLGGEAQRPDSALHARRMEVHEKLATMFGASMDAHLGKRIDPFLARALVLSLEAVPRMLFQEKDEGRGVTAEGIDRARRVMKRVLSAVLEGEGARVAPLPTVE